MQPLRAVLVCLDDSNAAPRVLAWALRLLSTPGAAQPQHRPGESPAPPTVLYVARAVEPEVPYDVAMTAGPEFAVAGERNRAAAGAEAAASARAALHLLLAAAGGPPAGVVASVVTPVVASGGSVGEALLARVQGSAQGRRSSPCEQPSHPVKVSSLTLSSTPFPRARADPRQALVDELDPRPELVVAGTRGLGAAARALAAAADALLGLDLGSVSAHLTQRANLPVTVVP